MPPCRLRQRIFRKFDYEMVHSEVYLNKYVVSLAPFSTPAYPPFRKLLFCTFLLFNFFHPFFSGGQLTPSAPMCRRPWVWLYTTIVHIRCRHFYHYSVWKLILKLNSFDKFMDKQTNLYSKVALTWILVSKLVSVSVWRRVSEVTR